VPLDRLHRQEHAARNLKPRTEASKEVLLRRVYLDLIGLAPTREELDAYESDKSANAYEKVVDRLLADARYGERWGRHWMDIWRYSDWAGWTDGGQVRDSKPHIWRWRDWIVESLNHDKGYDRMVVEMLAADELAPDDPDALRATGFLVRNFKLLSREAWLEDTVKHTSQAFLGLPWAAKVPQSHVRPDFAEANITRCAPSSSRIKSDDAYSPANPMRPGDGLRSALIRRPTAHLLFHSRRRTASGHEPDHVAGRSPAARRFLKDRTTALLHFASLPDKREFVIRDTIAEGETLVAERVRSWST
jgi:hypothetical protein